MHWFDPGATAELTFFFTTTVHEKDKIEYVVCKDCNRRFKASYLKSHMQFFHSGEQRTKYPCNLCAHQATTKGCLKRHVKNVHQNNLKDILKCTECDFTTKYKTSLNTHIQVKHTSVKKYYECDLCSFRAALSGNLKAHTRRMHKGIED